MQNVIEVENVSKLYQLGQVGTGTLTHDLRRWWARVQGKEDPFARVGQVNDRTKKAGVNDYAWALQNIDFSIQQGDVVGIIGNNGAGKSTLLKILSRITSPTSGTVKIKGRIGSLLEVGTGFHPEMTGRENVFMNGTVLGMRKIEITRKFDEIVDFAGVAKYIDTPVKRYSSGMMVRLGFAVAAFLEPEILIVDEVLAVGDAEFQKKALGKMQDVSSGEGRTVLFVSHNLGAVSSLCKSGIVLKNGMISFTGEIGDCINHYLNSGRQSKNSFFENITPNETDILSIGVLNEQGQISSGLKFDETINLRFSIQVKTDMKNLFLGFRIKDSKERNIFTSQIKVDQFIDKLGRATLTATIPANLLVPNTYFAVVALHIPNVQVLKYYEDKVMFEVTETGTDFYSYIGSDYGCVFVDCKWQ